MRVRYSYDAGVDPLEWPAWARGVELLRFPEDVGVGDTVERWAAKVGGAQFKAMAKAVGLPCRCAQRREEWNKRFPYSKETS